jgi:L-lactate dehydrogenase complex protein LldF
MSANTFHTRIRQSIADENLQIALDGNALRRAVGRAAAFASLPDYQDRRARAHAIKAEVISHLDDTLARFIARVTENGIQVHRASTAQAAIQIFLKIARDQDAHLVAKSKSMVSEEINLNHALEAAGIQVVETDLGEYIVQLRRERPSHILTPAVHLRRGQVGQLFHEKLGIPYTEDIPEMVAAARQVLRNVFLSADIGVSGVNFGVAETGTLCIVTNEGNGRMVTSVPPVHVALMGIERLVPTLDDLALFLSLLPRSGTGQKLGVYTSLIHSPKRAEDMDGPSARHLILVDNGRSALCTSPLAEALFCIRCGACLNVCPVFREIGGHAYRGRDDSIAPYPGPIGSVISPGLLGCENYGQLAQASSLCGACQETCPVDINLPDLLLRIRAGELSEGAANKKQEEGVGIPTPIKLGLGAFRLAAGVPGLFAFGQRAGGLFTHIISPINKYMRLPAWTGWGYSKNFPRLAMQPFRGRWKGIQQAVDQPVQGLEQPADENVSKPSPVGSLSDQFIDELTGIGGTVYRLPEKEVKDKLADFLHERGIERIWVDSVGEKYAPKIPFVRNPDPSIRVGVTGALVGIAETGSVVLVGGEGSPLTASLLPDIHIAIIRASDLVPEVSDALNKPEIRTAPAAVIITGPSRTADIEMTLSIGVHGPKELFVFIIDDYLEKN